MLCRAQYSRRVIPLLANPSMSLRTSCLLRILLFSAASPAQSRCFPQTLTIEQLRAICRSPRPTSIFNRRTSLILRTDNLLAGKLILPFEGEAACHCVVQRYYVPVEIIPAKPNAVPGSA